MEVPERVQAAMARARERVVATPLFAEESTRLPSQTTTPLLPPRSSALLPPGRAVVEGAAVGGVVDVDAEMGVVVSVAEVRRRHLPPPPPSLRVRPGHPSPTHGPGAP